MKKKFAEGFTAVAATDFDGTLYRTDYTVSEKNTETLLRLGEKGILRVIVTGRSYFSLMTAIDRDFPVDYCIVSSGSGIYEFDSGTMIYKTEIDTDDSVYIRDKLLELDCDFMIHLGLPDNHLFMFRRSGRYNPDFEKRLEYYREHGSEIRGDSVLPESGVSQFLVIDGPGGTLFERIRDMLKGFTVIRTTSPLDHASSWIEIFPAGTDKGSTLEKLAGMYGIEPDMVFSIGNDYNDLHMLRWAGSPFVVGNAADDIKKEFKTVGTNDDDGFSEAVDLWLEEKKL